MASLDNLPPDQRAVLQLVLQQGRSYDEIARLLSIDRAGVRERALAALDALGPQTRVPADRRGVITDYLLGALPAAAADDARGRLAESPTERAWARVVSSELAPLASKPLPEIPVESTTPEPATPDVVSTMPGQVPTMPGRLPPMPAGMPPVEAPTAAVGAAGSGEGGAGDGSEGAAAGTGGGGTGAGGGGPQRPISRSGGAILLGAGALVVVVVVVVIILVSGGSSKPAHKATSATASTPTTSTTSTTAQPIAQVNLVSPTGNKKIGGVAVVVKSGANTGLVIRAQGVPANTTHDAYAVWLYNGPTDTHILGFVNPGVKTNGQLQTAGVLPSNASHFKQLLVTLETQAKPTGPGKIVLQGSLNIP